MLFNNKQAKDLIFFLLKTFTLILGVNIFLTSFYKISKDEIKENNLESEMNFNSKKLIYNVNLKYDKNIY